MSDNTSIISGSEINKQLRVFLETHLLLDFNDGVTDQTNLFESGLIDSFGFIELVAFIEDRFHVELDDDVLISDELNTIASIITTILNYKK